MPLSARKIAHVVAKQTLLFQQRSETINLTLKAANNTTSVLAVKGILRVQQDLDPSEARITGRSEIHNCDALLMVPASDVTFAQLRACIYVEPAAPVGAELIASRYIITSITPRGLMPGADRYLLTLDRQRA